MIKSFKRYISAIAGSTLVLGLLAFVPSTFAAFLTIDNGTPTTFNITTQSTMDFGVLMNGYDKNYGVGFSIRGPLGNNEQNKLMEVHNYTGNDTYTFKWDGKINDVDVVPGEYRAEFSNIGLNPNPLIFDFDVVTAEAELSFNPTPASTYTIGSGDYNVSVELSDYIKDTDVNFFIYKKGANLQIPLDTQLYDKNETHEFTWNGNGATPGTYVIKATAEGLEAITREFEVKNVDSNIQLAFTSMPDNEYEMDSNDDYEASVKLTGADNVEVTATIDGPGNIELESKRVMDDGEIFVFTWDADDLDTLGDYELVIEGVGADNNLSRDFEVVKANTDDSCAGYKDVDADDENCDALEWLKAADIMTGQGTGDYFAGSDTLNRAELTRIALEAHDQYNANTDYCDGDKPFPDVNLGLWYSDYVCQAKLTKTVTGYISGVFAGLFKPSNDVSVVEAMTLLLRPLDKNMPAGCSYALLECGAWYSGPAKYSKDRGYYEGNSISPTQVMSRMKVATFLYELYLDGEIDA